MVGVQPVLSIVGFQTNFSKAGPFHRLFDFHRVGGAGNGVSRAVAQEERHAEERLAWLRNKVTIRGAVIIAPAHEDSGYNISLPHHLGSSHSRALSTAGESTTGNWPLFGLRPGTAKVIEQTGDHSPREQVI